MNEQAQSGKKRLRKKGQEGVAILMVLIALAILFPFTASFNYKARVDWQSAVNHGDEVRARAVQRGAMQLSVLMFELQRMVFNQKQFRDFMGAMDITLLAPYLMSIFGTEDGAEGLGALVGMDTSSLNELALDGGGSFEVRLEAESGKINVNCLALDKKGNEDPRGRVAETLEALMLPKLYDPLFDEEKANGERYNRQHTLQAIIDYIDSDQKRYDAYRLRQSSRDENTDYHYTELHDPYQPRNARLDSIEELHLVEAIDDDWMAAFSHDLTVYGGCKVNLNFASAEQIAQVLRHAVSGADRWKTEGDNFLTMTMPLANFVIESREFNLFEKLEDFKKLVAKPDNFINPMTLLGDDTSDSDYAANLPKVPDGMEVRVNGGNRNGATWGGLKEVATVAPERIYRLEIITTVGSVRKRLTAVYDIQYARSQSAGKGAWLYYRED
jgi:type II secretory pathway component PulK